MANPAAIMARLDQFAMELDDLSKNLADVERRLEPAEKAYEDFIDEFSEGLWEKQRETGEKMPGEDLRLRLARRQMPAETLGAYARLLHSRRRLERRISAVKASTSAMQSILSALKSEMEAIRS